MYRWLVWVGVVACGSSDPVVEPASPELPSPPPVERALPAVDAAACGGPLVKGAELGVWRSDLDGNNALVLHLHRASTADPAAPIGPGLEVVAWAELKVGDLDKLLDVPTNGALPDPGSLCARSVSVQGELKPGKVYKDERSEKNLGIVLIAPLPAAFAAAVWSADAMKPLLTGDDARLVPSFDKAPDGSSYLMVKMGDMGGNGYPPALEPVDRLRGDMVVTLVNGEGAGLYETHHLQ
jgi:hypothetical protein